MKKFALFAVVSVVAFSVVVPTTQALSCLPLDMYLKDVVKDDTVVIFEATVKKQIEGSGYTAEVVTVSEVKQGYVEKETFVYHQKDETWGYLCNNGPKGVGTTGLYIALRDDAGKYNVTQRLELTDEAAKTLEADLEEAEVTGELTEITKTDRMNQIITTISDMLKEIGVLLKEYAYWKAQ